MNDEIALPRHTIFLYTEGDNGGRLIESAVIGLVNDYSGDRLLVVRDPYNDLKFVYRVDFDTSNMEAVGVVHLTEEQFDSKASVEIEHLSYRLGSAEQAIRLLRKRTQWIQDKSSAMSVLLNYTASRRQKLSTPRSIDREKVVLIPPDTPVQTLEEIISIRNAAAATEALSGPDFNTLGQDFTRHFQEKGNH
ncbi:hypothetical protein [Bordetella sp. FB-8]|uniref:hypothetical protein n=1 Tax=Bordetella sp. FB-8 TaxID=1159870 RepID=UPI0003623A86|nr:hypothetical protein [Bordetella sp. FB-8]